MKFNDTGKLLFEFKLQPPVKKIKPEISHIIQDIGIDKDDKVYVWNFFEDRVEIYYPDGKYQESVGFVTMGRKAYLLISQRVGSSIIFMTLNLISQIQNIQERYCIQLLLEMVKR